MRQDHQLREGIMQKLMHSPGMSFNRLWDKQGDSNCFSYHLKVMEKEGLIENKRGKYYLTLEGKKIALYVDGATGKEKKKPMVTVVMIPYKDKDTIVMHERLKEPFYGIFGFPAAKLEVGEDIIGCAKRELREETGLSCSAKIAGVANYSTYNGDDLAYHHTLFVVKCQNLKGKLKSGDREGKCCFSSRKEFLSKKLFPDAPYLLEWTDKGDFFFAEIERHQLGEEFTGMKIKKLELFRAKQD